MTVYETEAYGWEAERHFDDRPFDEPEPEFGVRCGVCGEALQSGDELAEVVRVVDDWPDHLLVHVDCYLANVDTLDLA